MAKIVKCPECGKANWVQDPNCANIRCDSCGKALVVAGADLSANANEGRLAGTQTRPAALLIGIGATALAVILILTALLWEPERPVKPNPPGPSVSSTAGDAAVTDAWDAATLSQIARLRQEARVLLAAGKTRDAIEKYREIFRLVDGRQRLSSNLQRAIQESRREYDDAVDQIAGRLNPAREVDAPPMRPAAPRASSPEQRPAKRPVQVVVRPSQPKTEAGAVTDEEIGKAIENGARFLLSRMNNGVVNVAGQDRSYVAGLQALTVYALLHAGLATNDPKLGPRAEVTRAMLSRLCSMQIVGRVETYARALRATALSVHNHPEDRQTLKEDVAWLISAAHEGGYTYGARGGASLFDNSNSQYGLLGVWAGAEVGMEVPESYWRAVQGHWTGCQNPSGQWGYGMGLGRIGFAMNCAGLASLFVTHDYLDAPKYGIEVGRTPYSAALRRGLAWLEEGDHSVDIDAGGCMWFAGYNLYGLERVGLASGYKHFGDHDWYRELAAQIVAGQRPDGSWIGIGGSQRVWNGITPAPSGADSLLDTSYILLFLSRGRHPILMNKLRYDGAWANRPRDVANLARFASRELERPLNWQVVSIDRDWTDWVDSPILYLSGHLPPALQSDHLKKLREFVGAGGLLFVQSDGRTGALDAFASKLAKDLFPEYPFARLRESHAVFSSMYPMQNPPSLWGVNNGARLLMVYSPEDIASAWQLRAEQSRRNLFEMGVNLFVYAAGKRDLRNRLSSPILPEAADTTAYAMTLARLKHSGHWDPEPGAMRRLVRAVGLHLGWKLRVRDIDIASLASSDVQVAHLTGSESVPFDSASVDAVRQFVSRGGVLVIDAFGGSTAFERSVEANLITNAFSTDQLVVVPPDHPLLKDRGLASPGFRPLRRRIDARSNPLAPKLEGLRVLRHGGGAVILSSLDITSGLLGSRTQGIRGYEPEDSLRLFENAIVWAAQGCPQR